MEKYKFTLTPAYCLYNGIVIMEQNGSQIVFLTEKREEQLMQRVKRAFFNHLKFVLSQQDCPEKYKNPPSINFLETSRAEIRKYVSVMYSNTGEKKEKEHEALIQEKQNEAAAVLLMETLLMEARNRKATDIHIEKNRIQFRINGRLETILTVEKERELELIRRIKFLAGMNVMEHRRNQDGSFVYGKTNPLYLRVSTMGVIGEKEDDEESVVIRMLDTSRTPLNIRQLGFTDDQLGLIGELCRENNGLVLICGPTGAGKSTTAASLLVEIQKAREDKVKIITLEDPPEYVIPEITQIKINDALNNSYNEALTHVFRQDPDVLMIGEIRDFNSAMVAVRAALTGHLVFATLHTATASGAVLRLGDLGIKKQLLNTVLKGIIVQEMNFTFDKLNLLADVSIPKEEFMHTQFENFSEEELEKFFDHVTNYQEVMQRTIAYMAKRHKSDRTIIPDYRINPSLNEKEA